MVVESHCLLGYILRFAESFASDCLLHVNPQAERPRGTQDNEDTDGQHFPKDANKGNVGNNFNAHV
jgi:hypothetical protein